MKRVLTILAKELKDTIRDRRTLVVMVLLPIILMPLILVGTIMLQEWASRSALDHVTRLNVTGGENAPDLVVFLEGEPQLDLVSVPAPEEAIRNGDIDASLDIPPDFQQSISAEKSAELTLLINSTRSGSSSSVAAMELSIREYNDVLVAQRLEELGSGIDVLSGAEISARDTATPHEKGGTFLGFLLPMFLVLFSIVGGMYVAMDISAGEKERRTLESLLLTPVTRLEIVTGKFLTVAAVAMTTIVLALASIFVTAQFISGSLGDARISLGPAVLGVMLPVALLLAAMFASLLLALSIFAKSYKEAQNYVMPLYILVFLPIVVANTINIESTPLLFLIPGFNAVLLFRELLVGVFDPLNITITLASLVAFTAASIWWAVKTYSRDDVLLGEQDSNRDKKARNKG